MTHFISFLQILFAAIALFFFACGILCAHRGPIARMMSTSLTLLSTTDRFLVTVLDSVNSSYRSFVVLFEHLIISPFLGRVILSGAVAISATLLSYWVTLIDPEKGVYLLGAYLGWGFILAFSSLPRRLLKESGEAVQLVIFSGIGLSFVYVVLDTALYTLTLSQLTILSVILFPVMFAQLISLAALVAYSFLKRALRIAPRGFGLVPRDERIIFRTEKMAVLFAFGLKQYYAVLDLIFGFAVSVPVTIGALWLGQLATAERDAYWGWQILISNWVFDAVTLAVTFYLLDKAVQQSRIIKVVILLAADLVLAVLFAAASLQLGLIGTGHEICLKEQVHMYFVLFPWHDAFTINTYSWVMNSALIPTFAYMLVIVLAMVARMITVSVSGVVGSFIGKPVAKALNIGICSFYVTSFMSLVFLLELLK